MANPTQFRVTAQYANGFIVIGCCRSLVEAGRLSSRYLEGLDPDTDECPEMLIEETSHA